MHRYSILAGMALDALRQHPLRAFLSTLGLTIGVAALVAIMALADGMEQFARDQIASTTDLQTVTVTPRTREQRDGVSLRREVTPFTLADTDALRDELGSDVSVSLLQQRSVPLVFDTTDTAAQLFAVEPGALAMSAQLELQAGRAFTDADVDRAVVVMAVGLADRLGGADVIIGRTIQVEGREAEVIGVVGQEGLPPIVAGPYGVFAEPPEDHPPRMLVRADKAEDVPVVVDQLSLWLDGRFDGGRTAFDVGTNAERTAQVRQGMLVFKLIMGFITGISVVVGGVGVMNVLLMTVTERTREIGVRKATGARRRDIVVQFLSEAIAVSALGSVVGLALGWAVAFAAIPIIRSVAEVPFEAAFTASTLALVAIVAITVGIVFGTYPAYRAARLSPVEAIRHE